MSSSTGLKAARAFWTNPTVHLTGKRDPPPLGHQGLVGKITLGIKVDGRDDVISVLLHFAEGSLSLLEVVWYNFPDPVPSTWIETSRNISVGG
jgi:hypothetical protein